jgi:lipoprotein signal peptidase
MRLLSIILIELLLFQAAVYPSDNIESLRDLIPVSAGSVRNIRKNNDSDTWVIHIQNAHANEYAQRSIMSLLRLLAKNQLLDAIYVEGSEGSLDTGVLADYPIRQARDSVADYLMRNGDISGHECYSITEETSPPIIGVDSDSLYLQNMDYLRSLMTIQESAISALDTVKTLLDSCSPSVFSSDINKFIKYRDDKDIDLYGYIRFLYDSIQPLQGLYPVGESLLECFSIHRSLNFAVLEREKHFLLQAVMQSVSAQDRREIMKQQLRVSLGEIYDYAMYSWLLELANRENLDASQYDNVTRYSRCMRMYADIDYITLADECEKMEDIFLEKYLVGDSQKALYEIYKLCKIIRACVGLSASHYDRRIFFEDTGKFSAKSLRELGLAVDVLDHSRFDNAVSGFDSIVELLVPYYRLACERDTTLSAATQDQLEERNDRVVALITGGFHTPGICEDFDARSINYAVITPSVRHVSDTAPLYRDRILQTHTDLEKVIARSINSVVEPSLFNTQLPDPYSTTNRVKLLKAFTLLATSSTDFLISDQKILPPEALEEVNSLLAKHIDAPIRIAEYVRFDETRVYTIDCNGTPISYIFNNNTGESNLSVQHVAQDMQNMIERLTLGGQQITVLHGDIHSLALKAGEIVAKAQVPARTVFDRQPAYRESVASWIQNQRNMYTGQTPVVRFESNKPVFVSVAMDVDRIAVSLLELEYDGSVASTVAGITLAGTTYSSDDLNTAVAMLRDRFSGEYAIRPELVIFNENSISVQIPDDPFDIRSIVEPFITTVQHIARPQPDTDSQDIQPSAVSKTGMRDLLWSEAKSVFGKIKAISIVGLATFAVDWGTKYLFSHLAQPDSILTFYEIDDFAVFLGHFQHMFNSFEIIGKFAFSTILVAVTIAKVIKMKMNMWIKVGMGLQLGGLLGNVVEVMTKGYVTDWYGFSLPNGGGVAPNFADFAVFTGAFILIAAIRGILPDGSAQHAQELSLKRRLLLNASRIAGGIGLVSFLVGLGSLVMGLPPLYALTLGVTGWLAFIPGLPRLFDTNIEGKQIPISGISQIALASIVATIGTVSIRNGLDLLFFGVQPLIAGLMIMAGVYPVVRGLLGLRRALIDRFSKRTLADTQPGLEAPVTVLPQSVHLVQLQIEPVTVIVDADMLFSNWDVLLGLGFAIEEILHTGKQLLLFSATRTTEQILERFSLAGVELNTISGVSIIDRASIDEAQSRGMSLTQYAQDAYRVRPENILLVAGVQSVLYERFLNEGAVGFSYNEQDITLESSYRMFSVIAAFMRTQTLPAKSVISGVGIKNPHKNWFASLPLNPSVEQFASYLSSLNRQASLLDLAGMTVSFSEETKDKVPVKKINKYSDLFATSL